LLKNVKKYLVKSFAINVFFRIIVKGIADFAQMVGDLVNQVYIFINQAMNRTFTKNLWSDVSLQPFNHFSKQMTPVTGAVSRMTDY
jgi:5,10-methylene-tetrahydrofolate dehydrogenase/methenyl tetrahydrofolate cyclohydrolase